MGTFVRHFGDVLIFLVRNVWETVGRPLGDIWISLGYITKCLGDVWGRLEMFGKLLVDVWETFGDVLETFINVWETSCMGDFW